MKSHRLRLPVLVALALTAALRAQEIPVPLAPPAVPQQPAALPAPSAPDPNALKWDAETKEVNPKPGDVAASFSFVVTNVSDHDVMLNALRTSCGCTVAQLPSTPYKLEPGANVAIAVTFVFARQIRHAHQDSYGRLFRGNQIADRACEPSAGCAHCRACGQCDAGPRHEYPKRAGRPAGGLQGRLRPLPRRARRG